MSERKNKSIKLPKYDLEAIMQSFIRLCSELEFDYQVLASYIFADWLITLDLASHDNKSAFLSFLKSHELHVEKYRQHLKEVESAQDFK